MNRALKLLALVAIAEMVAVQIAVVAARWDWLVHFQALSGYQQRTLPGLAFLPAWTAFGMLMFSWQLKGPSAELSRDHRRFLHIGMALTIVFVTAVHNALALSLVARPFVADAAPMRIALIVAGVFTVAYGNYRPKVEPPTGPGAIGAAVFLRTSLRNGWLLVALGLGEIVCGIALARPLQAFALAVLAPIPLAVALSEWRLARQRRLAA